MKIQEATFKLSSATHKQSMNIASNFKQKIPAYINQINLSNSILSHDQPAQQFFTFTKKIHLETQMNKLRSQVSITLQTSTKFYLFLGRTMMQNYSQIIVYEYLKSDGQHKSMEMNGIKGEISCLEVKFCSKRKKHSEQKIDMVKNPKKSSSIKNNQQSAYQIVLLIGTAGGYLKSVRFGEIEGSQELKVEVESIKLDFCQIVQIVGLDSDYYNGCNVCLALSLTNRVYLVNFDRMRVVGMFLATILGCEVGLGLSVNYEQQYFIQTCEGGYIIFWDISEHLLELIKKSSLPSSSQNKVSTQDKTQNHSAFSNIFCSSSTYHAISPLSIFHSATITGLKHCSLYGNLLLIITQGGLLKLLAINKSTHTHVNQNEYCSLIEYQIEDGELITDVKFFPYTMEVFVVKSSVLDGVTVSSGLEKYSPVKQYNVEKQAQKKKMEDPTKIKVYKPKVLKSKHNNILPPTNKSLKNHRAKCYFERIVFNAELQIQKVDKIYPAQNIDCIESLELTECKDIIVLRAREFYLIGSTDSFKGIDLG